MNRQGDPRIPIVFGPAAAALASDAVLRASPEIGHQAFCACCVPRGKLLESLGNLFIRRARGEIAWFDRVLVDTDDEAGCRAAFSTDSLISARFRLG